MTMINWMFAGLEAVLWYFFIYYFMYSVKNKVNLFLSAFILLVLLYAAAISCPWIRHSDAWMRLFS